MCRLGGECKCRRWGFSVVISMGNKVDQTEVEIHEMLSLHQQTKVIVTYLEDIHDGHKFINICKQITKINSIKNQFWS